VRALLNGAAAGRQPPSTRRVDENDLVAKVQAHVRADHDLEHTPAKHILARLRRQGADDS
jgi:hypothetical protein